MKSTIIVQRIRILKDVIREIEKDIGAHQERERLIKNDFQRRNYDKKHKALMGVLKEHQDDLQQVCEDNAEYFI